MKSFKLSSESIFRVNYVISNHRRGKKKSPCGCSQSIWRLFHMFGHKTSPDRRLNTEASFSLSRLCFQPQKPSNKRRQMTKKVSNNQPFSSGKNGPWRHAGRKTVCLVSMETGRRPVWTGEFLSTQRAAGTAAITNLRR